MSYRTTVANRGLSTIYIPKLDPSPSLRLTRNTGLGIADQNETGSGGDFGTMGADGSEEFHRLQRNSSVKKSIRMCVGRKFFFCEIPPSARKHSLGNPKTRRRCRSGPWHIILPPNGNICMVLQTEQHQEDQSSGHPGQKSERLGFVSGNEGCFISWSEGHFSQIKSKNKSFFWRGKPYRYRKMYVLSSEPLPFAAIYSFPLFRGDLGRGRARWGAPPAAAGILWSQDIDPFAHAGMRAALASFRFPKGSLGGKGTSGWRIIGWTRLCILHISMYLVSSHRLRAYNKRLRGTGGTFVLQQTDITPVRDDNTTWRLGVAGRRVLRGALLPLPPKVLGC